MYVHTYYRLATINTCTIISYEHINHCMVTTHKTTKPDLWLPEVKKLDSLYVRLCINSYDGTINHGGCL